jgi:hypothetical protein
MDILYKNVKVIRHTTDLDSFIIKLPNEEKVLLTNCHATADFPMLGTTFICLWGNCEVHKKNGEIQNTMGILHAYGKPFFFANFQRFDLLIKNNNATV